MDELEFALENIRGHAFEDFAMAFLREQDYDNVHQSGESGPDGGWDAQIRLGDRNGIAHASVQETWRRKLRSDAEKVADLEEDRGEDYDLLVFVTNQDVGGVQEMDMEDEIREEYGWTLNIHHRKDILGELRQNSQGLAEDFFDVDLQKDHDHIEEIEDLCENRLDQIRAREGYASELIEGPAVVLHIIPNGILSKSKTSPGSIPDPSVLFEDLTTYGETKGKYTIAYGNNGTVDEKGSYAVLRNDGLYESASASAFIQKREETWIQGHIQSSIGIGLDAHIVLAARSTMEKLSEMGFSGTAFAWVSFLDAEGVQLNVPNSRQRAFGYTPATFETDRYTTEYATLQIGSEEVIADLEPILDEVWREFGEDGTPNIEDGEWALGSYSMNRETVLEEGDR
ncbi:restriction endonuclease [Natronomonas gomsonensis]|uniref:restriction endonuclease n=1 Tax=Natronomonas gomsonensis TaxID=1046043 RepID=UPI0020CA970E|nr:restriction endonuclease [Natronomonas gomsonensis]MCY4730547.1 restriction endonuclease [Natronomonas gomsonensis]